ncbi:MAG TPA: type II toxin-antitoxin system prevent-host-death family antitoxin [Candidatus Sulfomarinibacteraceae bacterium]|nr:type II toxin-antitoxin system prevent-host-death family antitoxin [Candidatus Sulfomarinibacteraceae bacterium]
MRVDDTIQIGAFEAKNRLSELLRAAEAGRSVVITRRGRPVARLVPAVDDPSADIAELQAAFAEVRSGIKGEVDVRELVEDGRRW